MKKHRIAIPEIHQDLRNYYNVLFAIGAEPVAITLQPERMEPELTDGEIMPEFLDYSDFRVEDYDSLVLPGGGDILPARYGQTDQGQCKGMSEDLDELQFAILDRFVKAEKPVLGTCRGQQLINVYFGGTLIQHLPTSERHARSEGCKTDKIHGCKAEKGSWMEKIYDSKFLHNSAHHQAIDLLGEGLVIDTHCVEDGVIEAVHHSRLPIYAVQWHPERMCLKYKREDTVNGVAVFRFFDELC